MAYQDHKSPYGDVTEPEPFYHNNPASVGEYYGPAQEQGSHVHTAASVKTEDDNATEPDLSYHDDAGAAGPYYMPAHEGNSQDHAFKSAGMNNNDGNMSAGSSAMLMSESPGSATGTGPSNSMAGAMFQTGPILTETGNGSGSTPADRITGIGPGSTNVQNGAQSMSGVLSQTPGMSTSADVGAEQPPERGTVQGYGQAGTVKRRSPACTRCRKEHVRHWKGHVCSSSLPRLADMQAATV